jgi:ComF family protein
MTSDVLGGIAFSLKKNDRFCGQCGSQVFTTARACGLYSGALEASILFLKTSPHVCPRLRRLLRATFEANRSSIDCEVVVPVPLHQEREKQRGFNQATLIAEVIASNFNLALDKHSLKRIKPTERHRAGMDAADRAKSVEQAFSVAISHSLEGASVLLVDDVMTTGSTVGAASLALLNARVARVHILTIARVQ